MKKGKIISLVVLVILLVGVIIFAATRDYEDSHLKLEGIRVRVPEKTIIVDTPDEGENAVFVKKTLDVNGNSAVFEFKYKDMLESGYPKTLVASINNKEFLEVKNLDLEKNMTLDYQIFLNFKVIGDYIAFSYTDGTKGRTTTLYVVDLEGNIILEENEIDKDNMKIKDYTEFLTYEKDSIIIYATKLDNDVYYKDESVCKAKSSDIVEAHYTYTLKNGKFAKKQTSKITAKDYIKKNNIPCNN